MAEAAGQAAHGGDVVGLVAVQRGRIAHGEHRRQPEARGQDQDGGEGEADARGAAGRNRGRRRRASRSLEGAGTWLITLPLTETGSPRAGGALDGVTVESRAPPGWNSDHRLSMIGSASEASTRIDSRSLRERRTITLFGPCAPEPTVVEIGLKGN